MPASIVGSPLLASFIWADPPLTLSPLELVNCCRPSLQGTARRVGLLIPFLLKRPAQEDRRGQRARDAHRRSRSHLRRGPLLRRALRQGGPGRGIAAPEEEPGQAPEGRRAREEAPEGAPTGEARRATLSGRCEYLRSVAGLGVSEPTVSRSLRRMGWTRKKDGRERANATSS